ncbi:MAG: hypothetical protein A4E69_00214 [Syntrophus sp. PtaB.Bin138]|nr:MAG: hypothetical protein A4E69_00214 [Syntrophus sp. PtaB.Bin138]
MGGVGVHEAAAVGAQHLDRGLRRQRTLCDSLGLRPAVGIPACLMGRSRLRLNGVNGFVGFEVLDRPLVDEEKGVDEAKG